MVRVNSGETERLLSIMEATQVATVDANQVEICLNVDGMAELIGRLRLGSLE